MVARRTACRDRHGHSQGVPEVVAWCPAQSKRCILCGQWPCHAERRHRLAPLSAIAPHRRRSTWGSMSFATPARRSVLSLAGRPSAKPLVLAGCAFPRLSPFGSALLSNFGPKVQQFIQRRAQPWKRTALIRSTGPTAQQFSRGERLAPRAERDVFRKSVVSRAPPFAGSTTGPLARKSQNSTHAPLT